MVRHRAHLDASVTLRATDQFHSIEFHSIDPLRGYPDRHYRVKDTEADHTTLPVSSRKGHARYRLTQIGPIT